MTPVLLPPRIRAKFNVSPSGCWLWHAAVDGDGYGNVHWAGKTFGAHRLVFQLLSGPIPEGLQIDHLCRETRCVNPAHLEPVTDQENKRRRYAIYTHCKHGHEFTPANTYVDGGWRRCRACNRRRARESQARRRARSGS